MLLSFYSYYKILAIFVCYRTHPSAYLTFNILCLSLTHFKVPPSQLVTTSLFFLSMSLLIFVIFTSLLMVFFLDLTYK